MILYDLGNVSKRKKTPEGYLSVDARIARAGVQLYDAVRDFKPGELPEGLPRVEGQTVRLLRPEMEVFSDRTLKSCQNKPITNGHPGESVSAENVRKWQVGFSRDTVRRDGDMIATDLLVQDKAAILRIEKEGVNQISLGYSTDVDWEAGNDPTYGPYDGVQRNINCNHIAIVKVGRAGPEVRLSDGAKKPLKGISMKTRLIDGITIEVTDQAGEALDKLTKQINDSRAELKSTQKELADEKGRADRLAGELDVEKSKALNVQAIDEMVAARMDLVEDAKRLAPKLEVKGLSDHEIRKSTVLEVSDSFDLEGKSEVYVEAVFDTLLKSHKPKESSALSADLGNLQDGQVDVADEARKKMMGSRNAWRKE
jgi:hypothetical protein